MKRMWKKGLALLLAICMLCGGLIGCEKDTPNGKLIYYYLEQEPKNLDPQVSKDAASRTVICNLFEGLARQTAEGEIVPGVAERWEPSSDGKVYTFTNSTTGEKFTKTAEELKAGFTYELPLRTGVVLFYEAE